MATAFTLAATTAEQQVFELSKKLSDALSAYKVTNPSADLKGFSVSRNIDTNRSRATISIVLPLSQLTSADGGLEIDTEEVLV